MTHEVNFKINTQPINNHNNNNKTCVQTALSTSFPDLSKATSCSFNCKLRNVIEKLREASHLFTQNYQRKQNDKYNLPILLR